MLVSIYIPTKNRAGPLRDAIKSALAQTYKDIEVLVVSDGSIDNTRGVLEELAASDSRLRWFAIETSVGAPAARNMAIRASSGDFLTGLDDDDQFTPDRIASFIDSWSELERVGEAPACLYSQDVFLYEEGRSAFTYKPKKVTFADLFESNYIGSQIFAPRQTFFNAGLYDEQMPAWQDLDLFLRILKTSGCGHLVDAHNYLYDAGEQKDRISTDDRRVRAACERLRMKYHSRSAEASQKLTMQMLRNYPVKLRMSDLATLNVRVVLPSNAWIVAKAIVRALLPNHH